LTPKELKLVSDLENLKDIQISIFFYKEQIVIAIFIPIYNKKPFINITIEPIPNPENQTLSLNNNSILIDEHKNIYLNPRNDNLLKSLVKIENNCLNHILNLKEGTCNMIPSKGDTIKEIMPGLILIKNVKDPILKQNCNNNSLNIYKTSLIKFENCTININDVIFKNEFYKIYDHPVFPYFMPKIIENKNLHINISNLNNKILNLELIETKRTLIEQIVNITKNNTSHIILTIIIILLLVYPSYTLFKKFILKKKQISINTSSSELQTKGGRVIDSDKPNII